MLDTTRNMMIVRKDYHEDNMMKKGDTLATDKLMIMKGNDNDDDSQDSQTSRSSNSNGNGSSQDYYDVMSRGSDEDELSLDLSDIDDSSKPVHDIILITDPDEGYHGDSNSDEEYLTPDECDEDMILNSILQTASHIYSSQPTLDKKSNDSQQTQSHQLPHHHHQHQHRIQQRRGSSERTLILPRRMTSVSWSTEIVTEVRFRPSTTEEEKETFYYTSDDMIR